MNQKINSKKDIHKKHMSKKNYKKYKKINLNKKNKIIQKKGNIETPIDVLNKEESTESSNKGINLKTKKRKHFLSRQKRLKKKKMTNINSISDDDIKKELKKKGIHIRGKQKQLMRDIYFFSKIGGINIHKE